MSNRMDLTSILHTQPILGVITDTEMLLIEEVSGKRAMRSLLLPLEVNGRSGLLDFLWQTGLSAVWVMPTTALSRGVTCSQLEEQAGGRWSMVVHSDPAEPAKPTCVLYWPKESSQHEARRLAVSFPEYAGWGWRLADMKSLLATVTYLDQAVGRHVLDAPNLVAHQVLADLTRDQPISQMRSSTVNLHRLPGLEGCSIPMGVQAPGLVWKRSLTLVEQRQKYLHKYTHFSHYLEACLNVQLGVGDPQVAASGRLYDGVRPGIWRVNGELAGSIFDGKLLPSCLNEEWMSTPQINCCRDIGYRMQVQEGSCWREAYAPLTRWATSLWQSAERLHTHLQHYRHAEGRANALHTLKLLAQFGVAVIGREQAAGGWGRPDWWAQITGRARALQFADLVRLARRGTMPALLAGDALWVVSDEPHPQKAVPDLLAARHWKGYAIGYEVPLPLSSHVREAFRSMEHADQLAAALDALAEEVS